MKYAIVLPAGSGKTTLSNKYHNLIDIDSLLNSEQQNELKKLCLKALQNNIWEDHANLEHFFINNKIKELDNNKILLLHHESKADKYNLEVIGSFKTSEKIMLKIANIRGQSDKFREKCTIHNYYICDKSKVLDSFEEIHNEIELLIKKYIK